METKFTKGEWDYEIKNNSVCTLHVAGTSFAEVYPPYNSDDTIEMESNAKLISSAPNMFKPIVKLQEWSKKYPPGRIYSYGEAAKIERELTEIVEEQLKAIQKAEQSLSF